MRFEASIMTPGETSDLLDEAIDRNCEMVLSLPSAGMVRHCRSRFLGTEPGAFVVESAAGESALIDACVAGGQLAGVSFKAGDQKVVFAVKVLKRVTDYQVSDTVRVEALVLQTPTEVKAIQRRSNYRVRLTPDAELVVKVWRISERAVLRDKPMASQLVPVTLLDLSCGGLGVIFGDETDEPAKICTADRLRVQLTYRDQPPFLVEGKMRDSAHPLTDGRIRTGVQFKRLEDDPEGRQAQAQLNRIIGELQREEARRTRLGMMKG